MADLFGEQVKTFRSSAYPAAPGTGPTGKKSRDCESCYSVSRNRTWYKCGLVKRTSGHGTDINSRSAACGMFTEDTGL